MATAPSPLACSLLVPPPSYIKIHVVVLSVHPDNPGSFPYLKIASLTTSAIKRDPEAEDTSVSGQRGTQEPLCAMDIQDSKPEASSRFGF